MVQRHKLSPLPLIVLSMAALLLAVEGFCLEKPGDELRESGLTTQLGTQVDLSASFTDSSGELRTLSEFVSEDKPLIIVPAYYDCPRLCGLLLSGVTKTLNEVDLELGTDYQVATVSFNHKDTPQKAASRRKTYHEKYKGKGDPDTGWHFLVGEEGIVKQLMSQIGFQYFEDKGEFAHTAALMVLTADGVLSQYFTGITFSPWDVKLALVEASKKKIGTAIDHVLLYCFRFDPTKGKYTWAAFGVMRAGGVLTLLFLVSLIGYFVRKERLKGSST